MEKFSYSAFLLVVEELKSKIVNSRVNNFTVINSKDFLISFTTNRQEKLLISLEHQNPFICLVSSDFVVPTIQGKINETLRKEIRDCLITSVEILNNDKVLKITMQRTNDYFERERKALIIELIPQRTNLIIINEKDMVTFAAHYTTLEVNRPVIKDSKYIPIGKDETFINSIAKVSIEEIKEYAESYLLKASEKRNKEKFETLIKHCKSRIKSLKNKENLLMTDLEKATNNLVLKQHGDALLCLNDNDEINTYVKENNIPYDFTLNNGQNANLLYKKFKKAKRTIEMAKIEIEKAEDEINQLHVILSQIEFMSEEELIELSLEMLPHKFKAPPKFHSTNTISFVPIENGKIFFGKNAKQNNELTFKRSKPSDMYFHIKDYHGSHVVISKSSQITNEDKNLAAEMCLVLSGKQEGEVYFTEIKNVKKSSQLGEANLLHYETILIKKINPATIEKLKKFKV